jgi:hypothetical protein
MGMRPTRRRQDDQRTADRVAAALALIRQTDERWHGLAVWLSRAGMDRDSDLLDRLVVRAERRRESPDAADRGGRNRSSALFFPLLADLLAGMPCQFDCRFFS